MFEAARREALEEAGVRGILNVCSMSCLMLYFFLSFPECYWSMQLVLVFICLISVLLHLFFFTGKREFSLDIIPFIRKGRVKRI